MSLDPSLLQPIEKPDGRRVAIEVYDRLRNLILSGKLRPGTILSQVEVARMMRVSRTPVREALRMLQEGGLVSAEPNFRCRVLGFDPADVEALYIKRILLESLGVAITASRITETDLDNLLSVVEALEGEESHSSFNAWASLHRNFHRLLVVGAGASFVADLETLELRSERYQSAYKGEHMPGWWMRGELEHRELYEAFANGDASRASELAARHLARTALELLAALAPEHDTSALRMSLQFAIDAASQFGASTKGERRKRPALAR